MEWIWDDGEQTWTGKNQNSTPGFVKWIQSEGRIFWIYGKPGAGKSTLMKQLTQSKRAFDLMSWKPKPVIVVSYFFYELGQPQEKQFRSLLKAILYALLQTFHKSDPRALSSIMRIIEPHVGLHPGDQKSSIREDEKLRQALSQTLTACQNAARLVLFVDGLDECEGDHRDQLGFLRTWIESSIKTKLSIKACIASRNETEIGLRLSMYPSLPIHNFTKANISAYVTRRLGAAWEMMSRQPDYTTAIFDQGLIDALVEKAEGVFLWVDLVATQLTFSIEEERTAEELWMQLNDMPDDLRDLYSRIVDKIPQRVLYDTINFLRLYDHSIDPASADRPLIIKPHLFTLWEFRAAAEDPSIAVSCKAHFEDGFDEESIHSQQHLCAIMKRRIQRGCKGLIHVEDTNNLPKAEVTLLHRTVKKFFIGDDSFRLVLARADQRLIRDPEISLMAMSLRLLKVDQAYEPNWINWVSPENSESTSERERMEKQEDHESDIVDYFLCAAAAAARKIGSSYKLYIDELDRVLSSRRSGDWASLYYRSYEVDTRTDWNTNLLCLAFAHGMDVYIEEEFKRNKAKILDRNQRPLLCYFLDKSILFDFPSLEILESLLSNGVDPNGQFQKSNSWTLVLKDGADFDYPEIIVPVIQRLLEYGANPTHRVYLDSFDIGTKRIFSQTLVYTTAFHVVLFYLQHWDSEEQLELIRLLSRHCKDFDAADSDGTTILAWADMLDKKDRDPGYALLGELVRKEITAIRQRQRVHALWK